MIKILGKIISVIGGCYTVEAPDGVYRARARGVFRKSGLKPMAGDFVTLSLEQSSEPLIISVNDRRNELVRPPLANLDCAVLVVSSCEPSPNAYVLDKLVSIFESKDIEPVFAFTKIDKTLAEEFRKIYSQIGYKTFCTNNLSDSADEIRQYLSGKCSALIGNSGVGKSSLMNCIFPEEKYETAEISKKLGRGRHTTRDVIFYKLDDGYIADTPGFSTVDVERYGSIPSSELAWCFKEFRAFLPDCRFRDCRHLKETDCAIIKAVAEKKIARSRYESYVRIFAEAKQAEITY